MQAARAAAFPTAQTLHRRPDPATASGGITQAGQLVSA
jgi:hypothetical protein